MQALDKVFSSISKKGVTFLYKFPLKGEKKMGRTRTNTEAAQNTEEVKYIKCQIKKADVDTETNIVTLTVLDISFEQNTAMWFIENLQHTWYTVELDISNDVQRGLLFDYLIKYTTKCSKYDKIIDKIEKGLIDKTWSFSEKMLKSA